MLTMRNTISVLFFQRKNANRMEEMQSVMARITINGKSAEINTGVKWKTRSNRPSKDGSN